MVALKRGQGHTGLPGRRPKQERRGGIETHLVILAWLGTAAEAGTLWWH